MTYNNGESFKGFWFKDKLIGQGKPISIEIIILVGVYFWNNEDRTRFTLRGEFFDFIFDKRIIYD